MSEELIPIIAGGTFLLIFLHAVVKDSINLEHFDNIENTSNVFLNFYDLSLKRDFNLVNFIQQLKFQKIPPEPRFINNKDQGWGNVSIGSSLNPIIFVPGLGMSPIEGTWNIEKMLEGKCIKNQQEPTRLWYPDFDKHNEFKQQKECWENYINVNFEAPSSIKNTPGVKTWIPSFGSTNFVGENYFYVFEETLVARGYKHGVNLFSANYDFRKICDSHEFKKWSQELSGLIEKATFANTEKPVILVGHSLGCVLINSFLQTKNTNWKKKYIKHFSMFSPTFGGTPQALKQTIWGNQLFKNFSGLQLMLPNSMIYGDLPLLTKNDYVYTSDNIIELLDGDTQKIYKNITYSFQVISLQAPGVPVYLFAGKGIETESSYIQDSITQQPRIQYPYYSVRDPSTQDFTYSENYLGDGLIPQFALEFPLQWTKYQSEPIEYRFYEGIEHKEILNRYSPVYDFISIL